MERRVPWENRLKKWLETYAPPAEEEKIRMKRNRKPNYNLIKQQLESQYNAAMEHTKPAVPKHTTIIKASIAANHAVAGIIPKHHSGPIAALLTKALFKHLELKPEESDAALLEIQKKFGYSKERIGNLYKRALETFRLFLEKLA